MPWLKRNAKAVATFVTNTSVQAMAPMLGAGLLGGIIGFWPSVILVGLIAAGITYVIPNVTSD